MTIARIKKLLSHGLSYTALLAIMTAAFIQLRPALADDAEPGDPCTGTCSAFIPGQGWLPPHECGGGCCCDWLGPVGGGIVWRVRCCDGLDQGAACTHIQLDDGSWVPLCQTYAGGNPCDGCPDLEIFRFTNP